MRPRCSREHCGLDYEGPGVNWGGFLSGECSAVECLEGGAYHRDLEVTDESFRNGHRVEIEARQCLTFPHIMTMLRHGDKS